MTTAKDLLAIARSRTGLHDYGDDAFREGLEVLVGSLGAEARLNTRGEEFIYHRISGYLAQRLQVEDWYRRHPEIEEVPVASPLIGIGLPRSGSTALSFLLAQDPQVRYLRKWESAQPCPPPSTVRGEDPRVPPDRGEMVGTRYHVPVDGHGPMECHELMALGFASHLFQSLAQIPRYSTWLVEKADLTAALRYERRVLKLLSWGGPVRPWRLKCPSHVLWLDHLAAVFPDAHFVMTHRDPTDVLLSVADLYADIIGTFTDHLDRPYIGALNVEHWSLGMARTLRYRAAGNEHRFHDVDFHTMQHHPIGEIERLYTRLGLEVSEDFARRMRDWWTHAAAERAPSSHADADEFGIDPDRIRPLFADYVGAAGRWTARPLENS